MAVKMIAKNEAWMAANWLGRCAPLNVWNTDKDAAFYNSLWFTPTHFRNDGKLVFKGSYAT